MDKLSFNNLKLFFESNDNRIKHIEGVINFSRNFERDNEKLHQAALYHDIGYSNKLNITPFHPINSDIKALNDKIDNEIVFAVLNHTCAYNECIECYNEYQNLFKNIEQKLIMNNTKEHIILLEKLTFCDLHVDSKGTLVTLKQRIEEVASRYDNDNPKILNLLKNLDYLKKIDKKYNYNYYY